MWHGLYRLRIKSNATVYGNPVGDAPHESAGDRPVRVEGGVEDGDLETDGLARLHESAQDRAELGIAESTGETVVHGRHGGIVENVGVEVDPEAGDLAMP